MYLKELSTFYKCNRKNLLIREMTCKTRRGESLNVKVQVDIPCPHCLKCNLNRNYVYRQALVTHLMKEHKLLPNQAEEESNRIVKKRVLEKCTLILSLDNQDVISSSQPRDLFTEFNNIDNKFCQKGFWMK
eukprot:TRINITY_DN3819_c0_g1_i1.p1 TRINITY_DN3819_c0_g1~~TRINITY_DN3819_c0_g1_i1.p1  ORF type:complete len:131 (-),score=11.87 TRINITY_DN3819_c0_g1_i1:38-430(-)